VANVVEFYIPTTFRKRVKPTRHAVLLSLWMILSRIWTPRQERGKLIEFRPPAKKSA
jgi:hypothetical protein